MKIFNFSDMASAEKFITCLADDSIIKTKKIYSSQNSHVQVLVETYSSESKLILCLLENVGYPS